MRKNSNINYVIGMARDFVNGDLDSLDFILDFNHEFITRCDKMYREKRLSVFGKMKVTQKVSKKLAPQMA
jgi:hypothetical protein